jgi:hypothetical protein
MKTIKQLIEALGVQPADLGAYASLDEEFRVLKKAYFKKVSDVCSKYSITVYVSSNNSATATRC